MSSQKRVLSDLTIWTPPFRENDGSEEIGVMKATTTTPTAPAAPETPIKKKKVISDYFNSTKPFVNARTRSIFEKLSKKELDAKLMEVKFIKAVVDNRIQIINEYLEKVENKDDADINALDNSKLKEELNYKNLQISNLEKQLKSTKFDLDYYIQEAQATNLLLIETERENRMMKDRIAKLEYELEKAKNN